MVIYKFPLRCRKKILESLHHVHVHKCTHIYFIHTGKYLFIYIFILCVCLVYISKLFLLRNMCKYDLLIFKMFFC